MHILATLRYAYPMHTPHVETLVVISFALSASVNKLDLRLQSERRQNTMGLLLDTFCISKDLLSRIYLGRLARRQPKSPSSPQSLHKRGCWPHHPDHAVCGYGYVYVMSSTLKKKSHNTSSQRVKVHCMRRNKRQNLSVAEALEAKRTTGQATKFDYET